MEHAFVAAIRAYYSNGVDFIEPLDVSTIFGNGLDISKSLSGLKVLLVEDNELNMEIAKFSLENAELESITMRKEVRD